MKTVDDFRAATAKANAVLTIPDMATVFEKVKGKYLDREAGLRLRHEIYEQGDARDVSLPQHTD